MQTNKTIMKFNNAQEAFEYYYKQINKNGIIFRDTKTLFNQGFYLLNPEQNKIFTHFRKWSNKYADREWVWYLSKNRSVKEIKKYAPIWDKMHNGNNLVQSNYGWQWNRQDQLQKIKNILKKDLYTRQAVLSIYDGKEIKNYSYDTPCTMSIHFQYYNKKLNMSVNMRSNDLWYGFCNDQYCFSKLLMKISNELNLTIGEYYHFSSNLHLYKQHLIS